MAFSLTKWYLDVVTADGSVAIAYWAEVRWKRLKQSLCGLLLHEAGAEKTPWRFSTRSVHPPALDTTGFRWSASPLALTADVVRQEPAFHHRLLDTSDGVVNWYCEVPRAEVRLRAGDALLEGVGYAERIEMSLLPWRIPANEIRWGRFLAGDTSIVWIDWRGDYPQQLVFRNGRPAPVTTIAEEKVQAGDGLNLLLHDTRVISDDALGGLLGPIETLRPLLEPIARTQQTRWLSRGELCDSAVVSSTGWALHELVRRR